MRTVGAIIKSIKENPSEWQYDGYRVVNKSRGVSIWVANGISFYQTEGMSTFNLWDKIRFAFFLKTTKVNPVQNEIVRKLFPEKEKEK